MPRTQTIFGEQVKVGHRIMPTEHPWVSFGEVVEVTDHARGHRAMKVRRTARSGSTRIELLGLPDAATYTRKMD